MPRSCGASTASIATGTASSRNPSSIVSQSLRRRRQGRRSPRVVRSRHAQADERSEQVNRKNRDHEVRFLNALDALDPERKGVSFTQVRNHAGLNNNQADGAASRLVAERILVEVEEPVEVGNKARRKSRVVRRRTLGE